MYVLGRRWQDGYLDYHRLAGEVRIQVRAWWPLEQLGDVFFEPPRSLRRLWGYWRSDGLREVALKVHSRLRERLRNRRFFCLGAGTVCETDPDSDLVLGAPVAFVAPCHPECVERVCLPRSFVTAIAPELLARVCRPEAICLYSGAVPSAGPSWDDLAGWSPFSGTPVTDAVRRVLPWVVAHLGRREARDARPLALPNPTPIQERAADSGVPRGELRAVLFGLGNYAKTIIIPKIDPRIQIQCVHEIEPTQMGTGRRRTWGYDTSGSFRADERYDVAFIAGYHHTHAPLAVHALRQGAWVVVEKPLVTTRTQLDDLLAALRLHPGKLYAGFQMRYNPLWRLARKDLALAPGAPVHYHCIVFETPLVRRHWYHWPNSCSRIVSNGCHWLDHFLFMNDWSKPERWRLTRARNGDIHVSLELDNGAAFSMSLTDHGSPRLGVDDHVELRANGVTVRVHRSGSYVAEDGYRILRRARLKRLASHRRMYQTISQRILNGQPGDSPESVEQSGALMLALEECCRPS